MKITAVIPIRKGSQRVKDKNLRPFANTTLLELKIESLLEVPLIDEIIVNTDSDVAIALVISKYGNNKRVKIHKREDYYASSQCSGSEFFKHLGVVTETDLFLYAPCTSPFIKPETINKLIYCFKNNSDCDCVSTVSLVKEFLWLDGKPINYNPLCAPNSQDLPNIVALNFGMTIISKEDLIKNSNIIGKHPNFVTTSEIESLDIDTPLDFYIAENIYIKTVLENKNLLD